MGIPFILVMCLFFSHAAFAKGEEVITQEEEYMTINELDHRKFNDEIVIDGQKYVLEKTDYQIQNSNSISTSQKVTAEIKSDLLPSEQTYEPSQAITKDDAELKLIRTDEKEVVTQKSFEQKVSSTTTYEYNVSTTEIPNKKKVTVTNAKTGEAMKVSIPLTEIKESGEKWIDTVIDIVYSNYDADYYWLNNIQVPRNDSKPALQGYEYAILQSMGLSSADYRILDINWNGGTYESNGVLCRNAVAAAQVRTNGKIAFYEDTIVQPEVIQKMYTSYYEGTKDVDSGKKEYKIKAVATYRMDNSKDELTTILKTALVATSGLLILAVLIIAILFVVSKKKQMKK